jgi:hypothetical protein
MRWRPVAGVPCCDVSDAGDVRCGCELLESWVNGATGYVLVKLDDGPPRYVHQLVLEAFVGPRPPGHQANHKSGSKCDNRLENLEWVTPSENSRHAHRTGLVRRERTRREVCRHGHPLDQTYRQQDRRGIWREWRRCSTCRRAAYRRSRYGADEGPRALLAL